MQTFLVDVYFSSLGNQMLVLTPLVVRLPSVPNRKVVVFALPGLSEHKSQPIGHYDFYGTGRAVLPGLQCRWPESCA